jgi:lipoprotein-anchoring transpeptidase ErfK/SrfK
LNPAGDFPDQWAGRDIREGIMFNIRSAGVLTVLVAGLACGGASAEPLPLFALFGQPAQTQIAPQAAEPAPSAGDESENAQLPRRLQRQVVAYPSREPPGTIIVDTPHTYLYYVLGNDKAIRYGIGVGRKGFTWSGVKHLVRKQEWPDWYPPPEMIARQPYLPRLVAGGPGNPLGARALYIGGTEYRIHGTNNPASIGKHMSSGCIRLTNDNIIDLYNRAQIGAKVIVLPQHGAPTHEAKNEPRGWRAEVQAAVEASRESRLETRPAHMSWNVARPAGLY